MRDVLNTCGRVPVNDEDVGGVPRLQHARNARQPNGGSAARRGRDQHLLHGQSRGDHLPQPFVVRAGRHDGADVVPDDHFYPAVEEGFGVGRSGFALDGRVRGRTGQIHVDPLACDLVGDVGVEGSDSVLANEGDVRDVVETGLDRPSDALGAVRVGGGVFAEAVGPFDDRGQFRSGELRVPRRRARRPEPARRHHFDDVHARLMVRTDFVFDLGDRVDLSPRRPRMPARGRELPPCPA